MREIPTGEMSEAARFAQQITKRFPLILPTDAEQFAKGIKKYNPPDGFFSRVSDAHQFMSPTDFNTELKLMGDGLRKTLGGRSYDVAVYYEGKSGEWIYSQLDKSDVHAADNVCFAVDSKTYGYALDIPNRPKRDNPLVVMDDFSISGAQIVDEILFQTKDTDVEVYVALLRASLDAIRLITSTGIDEQHVLTFGPSITSIGEALTGDDMDFLSKLTKTYERSWDPLDSRDAFFSTWYKVPDNYPDIFKRTGNGNKPFLLDDTKVIPPYRRDIDKRPS